MSPNSYMYVANKSLYIEYLYTSQLYIFCLAICKLELEILF